LDLVKGVFLKKEFEEEVGEGGGKEYPPIE